MGVMERICEQTGAAKVTYLSNGDLTEFSRQRKHSEQLNFTECWLEQLVICRYCFVGTVIVTGDSTQLGHL